MYVRLATDGYRRRRLTSLFHGTAAGARARAEHIRVPLAPERPALSERGLAWRSSHSAVVKFLPARARVSTTRAASKCSNHTAPNRPHPTSTAPAKSAKTFSDPAATSYGSDDQRRWPGDTHNRHQRALTLRYWDGRLRRIARGQRQCWTLWPGFASRGSWLSGAARRPGGRSCHVTVPLRCR
jgi:hypothetical protein